MRFHEVFWSTKPRIGIFYAFEMHLGRPVRHCQWFGELLFDKTLLRLPFSEIIVFVFSSQQFLAFECAIKVISNGRITNFSVIVDGN